MNDNQSRYDNAHEDELSESFDYSERLYQESLEKADEAYDARE